MADVELSTLGSVIKTAYEGQADTNAFTDAEKTKLTGIEASADVTDATNVNAAGAVMESDYNAHTILAATTDNTPAALTVGEQTLVGRITSGNIAALTATQVRTLLNVEDGADVTDATNVTAAGALMDSEVTSLSGIKTLTVPDNTTISAFGATLIDDADNTAARSTLGLVIGTNVQGVLAEGAFVNGDKTKLDGIATGATANSAASEAEVFTGTDTAKFVTPAELKPKEAIIIAVGDETTALTTGTAKVTFRMPYAFELSAVRASVTTAPAGSTIIVDINEGGTTIMTTNKLSIDAGEKTSTTAATAAGLTDTTLADDAEITIDIDQIGSGTAGAGLKVTLIGNRT